MPALRLLADDLTGALDSAARFVPLVGPVPVMLREGHPPPTAAISSATRECDPSVASAIVSRLAPHLREADIAFKKIDSLLRGNVAAELAACLPHFDHCVLAPAFPFQGRTTRAGRQHLHGRDVGVDLPSQLRAHGLDIPLRDAITDTDLDAIVAGHRALPGRILWCGTGGLAGALAGQHAVPCPVLRRPFLALIGSDHEVAKVQLRATQPRLHRIRNADRAELAALGRSLDTGAAAVCMALPSGMPRAEAAGRIAAGFAAVLAALPPPGTLFIAGGETLHGLCRALAVERLDVDGELVPGVATSVLRGGGRDGQRVVSKSGAFGDTGLLARLFGG
jgi:D-threonate/D-erythronate kinase